MSFLFTSSLYFAHYLVNSFAETEETIGMSTEMLQRLVLLEQLSLIRIQKQRLERQNDTICNPFFWLPMDNLVASEEPVIDIRFAKPIDSPDLQSTNNTIQRKDNSTPCD